jgi:hypothetical protein
VNPSRAEACALSDRAPAPPEVVGLHRSAPAGGKDEPVVLPVRPRIRSLSKLLTPVLSERFHAGRGERDRTFGVVGLRRDKPQLAADPLEGLDDFELRTVEVDILPAQSEQLTAA